jgi:phage FluMu protein Com
VAPLPRLGLRRRIRKASFVRLPRAIAEGKRELSKQTMRDEAERLVKEALERKTLTVTQGKTRIESKCGKCGALNRVSVAQGQVPYTCKECGEKQRTF